MSAMYKKLIVSFGETAEEAPLILTAMRAEHRTLDGLTPSAFRAAIKKAKTQLTDPAYRTAMEKETRR